MNETAAAGRAIIVYESMFGSTRRVAEAIAEGMRGSIAVTALPVKDAPETFPDAALIVVGAPTHVHGLSRPASRAEAGRWGDDPNRALTLEPDAEGIGVREWLDSCGTLPGLFAAFDTRADMTELLSGSAAAAIDKRLRTAGSRPVAEKASFLVDKDSVLGAGELDRARAWGRTLAQAIGAHVDVPRTMGTSDRTVVCWDGTEAADAAVDWAVSHAGAGGGTIEVVDVVDRALFLGDPHALERATVEEEQRLGRRIDALGRAHPGTVSASALLVGDPLEILTGQTGPGTLVVVGTRHRVGPRIRYGWSLGARLATVADGPVAIVPAEEPDTARARTGIVVGVDGSDVGRRALAWAARRAEATHQPLVVVHCWQEPLAAEPLIVPDDEFVDAQQSAHAELLDDHVRTVREEHPGVAVEPVLLRENPISALRSRSQTASMLVVGSRRLTGWKRAWLGSVSHGLLLDLAAPTVVVGAESSSAAG